MRSQIEDFVEATTKFFCIPASSCKRLRYLSVAQNNGSVQVIMSLAQPSVGVALFSSGIYYLAMCVSTIVPFALWDRATRGPSPANSSNHRLFTFSPDTVGLSPFATLQKRNLFVIYLNSLIPV